MYSGLSKNFISVRILFRFHIFFLNNHCVEIKVRFFISFIGWQNRHMHLIAGRLNIFCGTAVFLIIKLKYGAGLQTLFDNGSIYNILSFLS